MTDRWSRQHHCSTNRTAWLVPPSNNCDPFPISSPPCCCNLQPCNRYLLRAQKATVEPPEPMSLHFPHAQDPLLSKREKQEMLKISLDGQRRMKQEASAQQLQLASNAGNHGHHVPGLVATLPDATNVPRLNHIPGLDQNQAGYAPRFEGSPSPQQEKQPYMSAVSSAHSSNLFLLVSLSYTRSAVPSKYTHSRSTSLLRSKHSLATLNFELNFQTTTYYGSVVSFFGKVFRRFFTKTHTLRC